MQNFMIEISQAFYFMNGRDQIATRGRLLVCRTVASVW